MSRQKRLLIKKKILYLFFFSFPLGNPPLTGGGVRDSIPSTGAMLEKKKVDGL